MKDDSARGRAGEIREQPVSLIELFYDLIYVYAIARMTSIVHGAELSPGTFLRYVIASFVVLQAWMYMTNYVNRFGRARWYENAGLVVNMGAAVFMSNTISEDWSQMIIGFNASMLTMLGVVAVLYALRLREGGSVRGMAAFSLKTLLPVCAVYLAVAVGAPFLGARASLALDALAILVGIFGPAVVDRAASLDLSMISFPHLSERFELITIITFGETVVTVAEVFDEAGFGAASIMTFACVIALFGCYVVQVHDLVEHRQVRRGLHMIYCHFLIVIAVNLFTVSLNLLLEDPRPTAAVCAIAALALSVFFLSLFLLSTYHRSTVTFSRRDWTVLTVIVTAGCALTFSGTGVGILGFLAGPLLAAAGVLSLLLTKESDTKPVA